MAVIKIMEPSRRVHVGPCVFTATARLLLLLALSPAQRHIGALAETPPLTEHQQHLGNLWDMHCAYEFDPSMKVYIYL
jgi:hypothetical protein